MIKRLARYVLRHELERWQFDHDMWKKAALYYQDFIRDTDQVQRFRDYFMEKTK